MSPSPFGFAASGYRGSVTESLPAGAVVEMTPNPIRTEGELVCQFRIVHHHKEEETPPFEVRKEAGDNRGSCLLL